MSKALVITQYGDPDMSEPMAGMLVDSISRKVVRLDEGELASVKAEVARLRDKDGLRRYGDEIRLEAARRSMARKYSIKPVEGPLRAFLGLYGLICLIVATGYDRLAAWNRR